MLRQILLPLAISIMLGCSVTEGSPFGSWSASGVVVNKTFRATPLTHSLGVEGIYKLELRDKDHRVRRQMVTRAVFLAYKIGDEFNDLAAPPRARQARKSDVKAQRVVAAEPNNSPVAAKIASKDRLANVHFTQDMLPETEGF